MIWITEVNDTKIIFQFYERELPEAIGLGKRTKVNHVEYPGGFQTNQIIGTYDKPVEWTGLFYGTYKINGEVVTAKERMEQFKTLMGRPLRFGFPVPGMNSKGEIPGRTEVNSTSSEDYIGGDKGTYIIEEFDPEVKDYFHVEYKIKLIPHQPVEKVKPEQTTSVKVKVNLNVVQAAASTVKAVVKRTNHPVMRKANNTVGDATAWRQKGMIPRDGPKGSPTVGGTNDVKGNRPQLRLPQPKPRP